LKGSNRPGGFAPRPRPSSIPSQTSLSRSESLPSLPHNFFGLPPQSTGPRSPAVSRSPHGSTSAAPKTSLPPIYYSTAQTGPPASTSTNWSLVNPTAPLATPRSSHFSHPSTPTKSFIRRVASTSALSTLSTEPIFKNQASQTQVLPSSLVLARDNYQRAEIILSNFHDCPPFSFAEFLRTAFAPEALPHLSPPSRRILATWLQGRTTRGTRPAEILDLWYRHDYSIHHDNRQLRHAAFTSLTAPKIGPLYMRQHPAQSYFLPPAPEAPSHLRDEVQLYNAREGVEEWVARATLHRIDYEAHELTRVDGALNQGVEINWGTLKQFSVKKERRTIQRSTPVLWTTFQTVSFNRRTNDVKPPDSDSETGSDASSEDSEAENVDARLYKNNFCSEALGSA
ncbi:hypothetical protein FRC11_001877, partial [Ceratobasidium sp. 423]